VPGLSAYLVEHAALSPLIARMAIPGGSVIGMRDAAGNLFYSSTGSTPKA
jgi:hypothetical protein